MMRQVLLLATLSIFAFSCAQAPKTKVSEKTKEAKDAKEMTKKMSDKEKASEMVKKTDMKKKVESPSTDYKSTENEAVCTLKSDERKLSYMLLEGGGCAVNYSKFEEQAQVAKAAYDMTHCQKVYDRIKTRLLDAGFDCQ